MLDALRALQYEGTRGEVALNFREQGNEAAKERNWRDAKEFYTKGIAVLNVKTEDDKWEKPTDLTKEKAMQREAREACYVNRALCNLELSKSRLSFFFVIWFFWLNDGGFFRKLSINHLGLRRGPQS